MNLNCDSKIEDFQTKESFFLVSEENDSNLKLPLFIIYRGEA